MATVSICLDKDGVPVSVYGSIAGRYIGEQRSIVAVAEKGLDYWNKANPDEPAVLLSYSWDSGRDARTAEGLISEVSNKIGVVNFANWLVDNVRLYNGYALWEYTYHSYNNMKPG